MTGETGSKVLGKVQQNPPVEGLKAEVPLKQRPAGGAVALLLAKYWPNNSFRWGLTKSHLPQIGTCVAVEVVSGRLATAGSPLTPPKRGVA